MDYVLMQDIFFIEWSTALSENQHQPTFSFLQKVYFKYFFRTEAPKAENDY